LIVAGPYFNLVIWGEGLYISGDGGIGVDVIGYALLGGYCLFSHEEVFGIV